MREVVHRRALDDRLELLARLRDSGPSGSTRGRAPRGSRSCRARGRGPSRAGSRRPSSRPTRAARCRAGTGRRRQPRLVAHRALTTLSLRQSAPPPRSTIARAMAALAPRGTCCSPVGVTIVTSFCVRVEPDVGCARCRSPPRRRGPCARASPRARSTAALAVLGREADQRLARAARGRQRGQHVRRWARAPLERVAARLLDLVVDRRGAGGSRPRPPPSQHVGAAKRRRASRPPARRPSRRPRSRTPGGRGSDTFAAITVTSAPRAPPPRPPRSPSARDERLPT